MTIICDVKIDINICEISWDSPRGYDITRAVICVPAKFGLRETKATQEAFERAGMKVMRVLEERQTALKAKKRRV